MKKISFDEVLSLLEDYKKEYGDILVSQSYTTKSGIKLGTIVNRIRTGARKTSEEEKAMLNDLGFAWKVKENPRAFEEVVKLLEDYKKKYGDLLVPYSYTTENGIQLGWIVSSIRKGDRKTSTKEKSILNNLGFVWERTTSFDKVLFLLEGYKKKYGDLLVPQSYTTENGIRLGGIVDSIRTGARKTSEEEKAMLNKLGFVWKVKESLSFEEVIKLLEDYKKKYGDLLVPQSYATENGIRLGVIVHNIRGGKRKTSTDEKAMLNKLGFVWNAKVGRKKKM